jgi:hypothetical protein
MYAKLCPLPLALAVADKAFYDFSNQWLAGLQPKLSLETGPDGQIWISSRVVAADVPTSTKLVLRRPAEEAGPRHRPRHHGPSQQRRRLRREAARAAAATAEKTVEKAVEKAAEKENDARPSPEKDAQSLPPNYSQVAVAAAEEALPANLQPSHLHDQNLRQTDFRSVVDELCPDGVYHAAGQAVHLPPLSPDLQSPNIPQVDGQEEIGERQWWCYCCQYAKLFPTEDLLQQHHDEPDHFINYEECNICYPWHVWT